MLPTLLTLVLASSPFVAASVQTPALTSCSSTQKVRVDGVTITNARIGQTMAVNFTLTISESLGSNPNLQLTIRKQNGNKIDCISSVGSCTYKLCGGTKNMEQSLAQQWNNQCPVPAITVQESIHAKLDPVIEFFIGNPPTTLSIELKVSDGGTTVGCQSFKVTIQPA